MSTSIAYRVALGVAFACVVLGWSFLLSLGSPAFAADPPTPEPTETTSVPTPEPTEPEPSEPLAVVPEPTAEPVGPHCAAPDTATPETTCYVRLSDAQVRNVTESSAKVELAAAVLVFFVSLHVVASFGRRSHG